MTPEERFLQYVNIVGECWEWTGGTSNGYPHFSFGGRGINARRFNYENEFLTTIPEQKYAKATCGNQMCVNADHVELLDAPNSSPRLSDNKPNLNNTSGFKGVQAHGEGFRGVVSLNGNRHRTKTFPTAAEANEAVIALRAALIEEIR